MTITNLDKEKVIHLLKKDAERRYYIRNYMREYREKLAKRGIKQKQYNKDYDNTIPCNQSYYKKSAIEAIKYLFK